MDIKREQKTVLLEWDFPPDSVQFWWPVGRGSPHLYTLKCTLHNNVSPLNGEMVTGDPNIYLLSKDGQLHEISRRVGFRDIQLIQEPLLESPGTSFYFKVNGVKIFIGGLFQRTLLSPSLLNESFAGSNWIPADSFLTTVSESRYRAWLQLLVRGNQNCVRVWGGGIYEHDIFYDICDGRSHLFDYILKKSDLIIYFSELGILVWQDFPFACGVYPAHDEFVELVQREARCNLERLRYHPSLFLLCGNNEDYQQILQWGEIRKPSLFSLTNFSLEDVEGGLPAIKIYEKILPNIVEELTSPPLPYIYGSPYGGEGWDTSSPFMGDVVRNNFSFVILNLPVLLRMNSTNGMFGQGMVPLIRTTTYWEVGSSGKPFSDTSFWIPHKVSASSECLLYRILPLLRCSIPSIPRGRFNCDTLSPKRCNSIIKRDPTSGV
jgi:beta-mannosidase